MVKYAIFQIAVRASDSNASVLDALYLAGDSMSGLKKFLSICVQMIWKYVRISAVYGPCNALLLMFKLYRPFRLKGEVFSVKLPHVSASIFLRSETSDISTFFQVFVDRQYEISRFRQSDLLRARYTSLLNSNTRPLIIDCGANIGLSVVWFANKFPESVIYAIEPSRENFSLMKKNLSSYTNVELLHGGIWDTETSLSIMDEDVDAWAFQVQETNSSCNDQDNESIIKSYTMNGVRNISGIENIFIAKIDIEGSEDVLFRSNTEWCEETDLLIVELHDWQEPGRGRSRNFFRRIAELEFDYLSHHENIFIFRLNNFMRSAS